MNEKINMNKRISLALIGVMLIYGIYCSVAFASFSTPIGSPIEFHNLTHGTYSLYSTQKNEIFEYLDGYIQAFSVWWDGYGYQLLLRYSDDYGESWNSASGMSGYYWKTNDEEYTPTEWHDCVYDNETECLHVVWWTTHYSYNYIRYARFIQDGDGTFTRLNQTDIDTCGTINYFSCAITLNETTRAPIITAITYESGYKTNMYCGNAPDSSSWTETNLGNIGYAYLKTYSINATHNLMIYSQYNTDGKLQGRYFDNTGFLGTAFDITEEDVESDNLGDSNGNHLAGWSVVCEQDLDFNVDFDTIMFVYINNTLSYKGILWNETSNTILQTFEFSESPVLDFWCPNIAKSYDSYFATIYDRTATSTYDLYMWEFFANGTITEGELLDSYTYSTTQIPDQSLGKTIFGDYLILGYRESSVYSRYIQRINATGEYTAPPTEPTPEVPPDYNTLFFYGGVVSVILILIGIVISKTKIDKRGL